MKKNEFLRNLEDRLQGLPKAEITERINFYDEMIEDMIEEGMTEEEAVYSLGGTNTVVTKIADQTKMSSLVKERIRPRRKIKGFEIVLLVLGFPLWFPLLMMGLMLFMFAFILLWVLVVVTYSVEASFVASGAAGLVACAASYMDSGSFNLGYLGVSIGMLGVACIFLTVCYYATKLNVKITRKILLGIKSKMIGGKQNA